MSGIRLVKAVTPIDGQDYPVEGVVMDEDGEIVPVVDIPQVSDEEWERKAAEGYAGKVRTLRNGIAGDHGLNASTRKAVAEVLDKLVKELEGTP